MGDIRSKLHIAYIILYGFDSGSKNLGPVLGLIVINLKKKLPVLVEIPFHVADGIFPGLHKNHHVDSGLRMLILRHEILIHVAGNTGALRQLFL